jgi:hypothetical protein
MRRRTCLLLLFLPALTLAAEAQEKPSSEARSHVEFKRLSDAELNAYGELDKAARAANETLVFQLLNLTGTTFRMWYCNQPPFDDKVILARFIERARLPKEQVSLFQRWYVAEIRFSGHSAAVWRTTGAEQSMRGVECTEDKLASSRAWIKRYRN